MSKMIKNTKQETSQQELHRLISWVKDSPEDWRRICHPESYEPNIQYISALVEQLYQNGLYTLIFVVLCENNYVKGVGRAIDRTVNEYFLELPMERLMEQFRKNLKLAEKELLAGKEMFE